MWAYDLKGTASGTNLLPMDDDTLYSDTVLGDLAWRSAGDMALGFAQHLGAKPAPPKTPEPKPNQADHPPK